MPRDIELLVRAYNRRVHTLGRGAAVMHDADEHDDPDAITAAEAPTPLQQEHNPKRSGTYVSTCVEKEAEVVQLKRMCYK